MIELKKHIQEYISYCGSQKHLSRHTIKAYKIDLFQYINFESNIQLSRVDLENYIEMLHKVYKPKTIKRKIASLKAFAHYLYYKDILESNPFDKIKTIFNESKLLPRTIPEHILHNIVRHLYINIANAKTEKEQKYAIRNAAVIEMLFATGARVSEICSLKMTDVDLNAHKVRILGKGSRERIIEIENHDVLCILKQYKTIFQPEIMNDNYFFLNNRGKKFSEQSVRTVIKNIERQIESEIHITPHMFRHSVATLLLEEDVDIRYIQRILGHSSITTTQIYTHVTSSKQKEIIKNKHPRNKWNLC